jgi:hypothetical protein
LIEQLLTEYAEIVQKSNDVDAGGFKYRKTRHAQLNREKSKILLEIMKLYATLDQIEKAKLKLLMYAEYSIYLP